MDKIRLLYTVNDLTNYLLKGNFKYIIEEMDTVKYSFLREYVKIIYWFNKNDIFNYYKAKEDFIKKLDINLFNNEEIQPSEIINFIIKKLNNKNKENINKIIKKNIPLR